MNCEGSRMSLLRIVLSLDPVLSMFDPQLIAPTLLMWPVIVLIFFILWMSQIWTYPDSLPIAMQGSLAAQPTELT